MRLLLTNRGKIGGQKLVTKLQSYNLYKTWQQLKASFIIPDKSGSFFWIYIFNYATDMFDDVWYDVIYSLFSHQMSTMKFLNR